jgi:hypothetical protein
MTEYLYEYVIAPGKYTAAAWIKTYTGFRGISSQAAVFHDPLENGHQAGYELRSLPRPLGLFHYVRPGGSRFFSNLIISHKTYLFLGIFIPLQCGFATKFDTFL